MREEKVGNEVAENFVNLVSCLPEITEENHNPA
jgi:hypothetical protein